jgi:hypothetical protein
MLFVVELGCDESGATMLCPSAAFWLRRAAGEERLPGFRARVVLAFLWSSSDRRLDALPRRHMLER